MGLPGYVAPVFLTKYTYEELVPFPIYYSGGKVGVAKPEPERLLDVEGGDIRVTDGELEVKEKGTVGNQTDPSFAFGIQNAGIDEPELYVKYTDSNETDVKVFGLEKTGTLATVRAGQGSAFETFNWDGVSEPTFRLNSYPTMRLQMGPGGSKSAAGGMVRATNVVTVTTTEPHGFGVGQTVTLSNTVGGTGDNFGAANYTVASVPDSVNFTYAQTATNSTSTGVGYWSAAVDVEVTREAYQHMGFKIGGNRKFSIYADSMTTEDSIRFATAGSFETSKITATTTTPYTLAVEFGVLVNATGGAKTVNLPAAAGCKGRQYFIKKTDVSVNTVTVDGNDAETIDGSATKVLTAQYDRLLIVSDGTNWQIISAVIT